MSHEALGELVDELDRKYQAGHQRLRQELEEQGQKIESNYTFFRDRSEQDRRRMSELAKDIETLGRAPVNVDKIIFSPRVVFTIVVSLLSIYGFFLASTSSMRTDIHDLAQKYDSQQIVNKAHTELQDMQQQSLQTDVADLKHQLQQQQIEIANLKTQLAQKGVSR